MKVCLYCGQQNEDSAVGCPGCGTAEFRDENDLNPAPSSPTSPAAVLRSWWSRSRAGGKSELESAEAAAPPEPVELQWRSRDAWRCLGMFVVFEVVLGVLWSGLEIRFPAFRHWSRTGLGRLVSDSTYATVNVLSALYFARTETFADFLRAFGLQRPPSSYVWFGMVAALGIRVMGHFIIHWGWSRGVTPGSIWGFYHTQGTERYLYVAPVLLAPFWEEVCRRGFLYRAFRGSYSLGTSILLIVAFTAVTHWGQVSRSWVAALDISALTVCQCMLRERGNLWDCILCHLVFNVTGAFASVTFH